MGQLPIRTGMTTIGISPRSPRRIQKTDPTLAEALKPLGYAAAQFGKNHLGDRNKFLPTVHGFDEWFGNRRQRCTFQFQHWIYGCARTTLQPRTFPNRFHVDQANRRQGASIRRCGFPFSTNLRGN